MNTKSRYIPQVCYTSGEFNAPSDLEIKDKYKDIKFKLIEHFKSNKNQPLFKTEIAKAIKVSVKEVSVALELGRKTFVAVSGFTKNECTTNKFKVHDDVARFWDNPFY